MVDFSPLATVKKRASGKSGAQQPAALGRFELRRVLGRGAQSVVWLAFDPRLEREVAIKLLRADKASSASTVAQWLQEARSVSRLTHPNIVPVFEADVHDDQPYLVFEYVQGQTLAQVLKTRGALPPSEAVALMIGMLDALGLAHASGVIHRDLKPSNVLVDAAGRARVMDFGIAARAEGFGAAGETVAAGGTPGYMSPEAAAGEAPSASMDIFSAGLVLVEMLSGKPLIFERDGYRAVYRVMHEQLTLPVELAGVLDDRLRAIILRALAKNAMNRHPSAHLFREELQKWAMSAGAGATSVAARGPDGAAGKVADTAAGGAGNSTLEFLLRRMRHKSDFPAMSDSVVRIQSIATSDKESVGSLTNEILKDVALTNKLLRLVNTVTYSRGGSISTVSRAVNLVGFNGIRNMALSLVLLEHMQDKAHANVLKEEFLRSLMAGSIAGELSPNARTSEEAFIGAMFQNLGRLLAEFYFPEEARTVRDLHTSKREPVSEAAASASVLGLSYQDLGLGVAKAWGLPESLQRCMRKPSGEPPARVPEDAGERQRCTATAANEIADALLHSGVKELDAQLLKLAKRHCRALDVTSDEVQAATAKARLKLIEMAQAMDLKIHPGSAAAKLLQAPVDADDDALEVVLEDTQDSLVPHQLLATPGPSEKPKTTATPSAPPVAELLAAGIQDITNAMVEEFRLTDVLRMILETMFRAMAFQRVVFCMRDPKTECLTGRFGLGQGVEAIVKSFNVPLKAANLDLFGAVCAKGVDTMISDATEARIAQRLPEWYRKNFNAPTFLLLPLQMKGTAFGLIYADKGSRGGLVLDEKELALLRTLRNQAVMAFKQAG